MSSRPYRIALIKGDGIGVDVTEATVEVLTAASRRVGNVELVYQELLAGAAYFAEHGVDVAPGVEEAAGQADAIFLGAIGLPSIRHADGTEISPHLRLRDRFGLYAGVRPIRAYPNAPVLLKDPRAAAIDFIVLRESTEGLFYSAAAHDRNPVCNDDEVQDIMRITRPVTEKLHDFAFRLARRRKARGGRGKVTCVDKANVFRSMAFFRRIFDERGDAFPDIERGYNHVDAQALELIRKPWEFDVLVTENIFGDILSDLGGGLVGGMGLASCAEIGDEHALFQPAHGSAPDIVGQDKANPLAAILSGGLMLDHLAGRHDDPACGVAAQLIDRAIESGFAARRLRPMEFGGDMGTRAVTAEVLSLVHEVELAVSPHSPIRG